MRDLWTFGLWIALFDAVLILVLLWRVRGKDASHVHRVIGRSILALYAVLAVTTILNHLAPVERWPEATQIFIQWISGTIRVSIAIFVIAWVAWEFDVWSAYRYPGIRRMLNKFLMLVG